MITLESPEEWDGDNQEAQPNEAPLPVEPSDLNPEQMQRDIEAIIMQLQSVKEAVWHRRRRDILALCDRLERSLESDIQYYQSYQGRRSSRRRDQPYRPKEKRMPEKSDALPVKIPALCIALGRATVFTPPFASAREIVEGFRDALEGIAEESEVSPLMPLLEGACKLFAKQPGDEATVPSTWFLCELLGCVIDEWKEHADLFDIIWAIGAAVEIFHEKRVTAPAPEELFQAYLLECVTAALDNASDTQTTRSTDKHHTQSQEEEQFSDD